MAKKIISSKPFQKRPNGNYEICTKIDNQYFNRNKDPSKKVQKSIKVILTINPLWKLLNTSSKLVYKTILCYPFFLFEKKHFSFNPNKKSIIKNLVK